MQPDSRLYADQGDSGLPNETLVKKYHIKSVIQQRSMQHKPLTDMDKRLNKWVAKICCKVERVLDKYEKAGLVVQALVIQVFPKLDTQHVLESIAYHLYRSPNIILKGIEGAWSLNNRLSSPYQPIHHKMDHDITAKTLSNNPKKIAKIIP